MSKKTNHTPAPEAISTDVTFNFVQREGGPERLVSEAELVFPATAGILAGLKLVGFSLWKSPEGEIYVTFPSRAFGAGSDRRLWRGRRYGLVTPRRAGRCDPSTPPASHNVPH
ncbi:MAG TPA: hypothetical protein VN461_20765 [Vicinamibacteria bacterium]|jgi:hypothetical protein|nr:hypothetical protein [Vicinamibacteria bacterium]